MERDVSLSVTHFAAWGMACAGWAGVSVRPAAQAVQAMAPRLAELQADATLRTMLSLLLPRLRLDAQAIKLQVNEGDPPGLPSSVSAPPCMRAASSLLLPQEQGPCHHRASASRKHSVLVRRSALQVGSCVRAQVAAGASRCTWTATRRWMAGG
jgi:hypothetical protein